MATIHIVTGKVIKVSIGGKTGNRVAHILSEGDVVPEGVDAEQLKRLEERGLIKKAKSAEGQTGDITVPEGDPVDSWTVPQLELFAKNKSIDLTGAGNKGEKFTAIQTALAAAGSGS